MERRKKSHATIEQVCPFFKCAGPNRKGIWPQRGTKKHKEIETHEPYLYDPGVNCMRSFNSKARVFSTSFLVLGSVLITAVLLAGCKTPSHSEESFVAPFDAEKVARLSHQAYRVAWSARHDAARNLRFAPFQPSPLDWEAVGYIYELSEQVPWLARKIEKNPASPRAASMQTYEIVAFDAIMLRARYQPTSFTASTCAQIEHLLSLIDEIAPYYAQKEARDSAKGGSQKGSS